MFNFDQQTNRKGTNCIKWDSDGKEGNLPFTIADMDFECAPAIIDAITRRVSHRIFGYTKSDIGEVVSAMREFSLRRHNYAHNPAHAVFSPGIVPAIGYLIEIMTKPNDSVAVLTPAYPPFFGRIMDTKRKIAECPMLNHEGRYEIDFDAFEHVISESAAFILCNPHNPTGRVWTEDELSRILEICKKYGVKIISDEIHRDLTRVDSIFTPFEKIAGDYKEHTATCVSASKTFNLSSLPYSCIIIPGDSLREEWRKRISREMCVENVTNPLCGTAVISAFTECDDWLDELKPYLDGNMRLIHDFLERELPKAVFTIPEATYLCWIDLSAYAPEKDKIPFIREKAGVTLTDGAFFGGDGNRYVRMNAACQREILAEGLERLKQLKD